MDNQRKRDDLYDVSLRPHDERVEVGGWTYYVRAVKRDHEFTTPQGWITQVWLIDLPLLLVRGVRRVLNRRRPWTVGVVRFGSVSTWNDRIPIVVHREVLQDGEDPSVRIAELVKEVSAGRFAPRK